MCITESPKASPCVLCPFIGTNGVVVNNSPCCASLTPVNKVYVLCVVFAYTCILCMMSLTTDVHWALAIHRTLGFSRSTLKKKKPSLSFVTSPTHICLFSPISLSFSLLSTWPAHLPTSLFSFLILGGFEVHLFLFFRWTAGKHLWTERTVNLWLYSHWAKEMKGEACVSSIVVLKVHFLKERSHKLLYKVLNHLLLKHELAAFLGYKSQ